MTPAATVDRPTRRPSAVVVVPVGVALVLGLALATLVLGSPVVPPAEVWRLLVSDDGSQTAIVLHTLRLPRAVLAVAAGAALAVAGVVMQALTRNPLADPGILGVNAGASFAVTVAVVLLGTQGFAGTLGAAFVGAAVAGVLVAVLGGVGRDGSTARLVLAGVAVGAVLVGFGQALALWDPGGYARIRVWEAGSLAGRDLPVALGTAAMVGAGLVVALATGPGLNLLVLGEEQASTLGARVTRVRAAGLAAIVLLCGTATAAVGPVAFVGLLVPHALRPFTGADQVRALSYGLLAGPALLLGADLLARTVAAPLELPLGVVTAVLGAPLLIALAQRRRRPA